MKGTIFTRVSRLYSLEDPERSQGQLTHYEWTVVHADSPPKVFISFPNRERGSLVLNRQKRRDGTTSEISRVREFHQQERDDDMAPETLSVHGSRRQRIPNGASMDARINNMERKENRQTISSTHPSELLLAFFRFLW